MLVVKRDGRTVDFDEQKIRNALLKTFKAADGEVTDNDNELIERIVDSVSSTVSKQNKNFSVEDIQDLIEKKLMGSNRKDIARLYITYRNDRTRAREGKTVLIKNVREKLSASNVQNQNANVDEKSFGGRKGEALSELMKKIALDDCVSKMSRKNHENNEIYIHDLDSYAVGSHNCLTIPFDDLLKNGFNTRQTDVRPANSISTTFQLVAVIFQLQSLQQFGGVSSSHLDWTMVPYVRKSFWKHFKNGLKYIESQPYRWDKDFNHIIPEKTSIELPKDGCDLGDHNNQKCGLLDEHMNAYQYAMDMTVKEVYQAVEGLYHNLNTLQSRSGNQLNKRWLAS